MIVQTFLVLSETSLYASRYYGLLGKSTLVVCIFIACCKEHLTIGIYDKDNIVIKISK